MLVHGFFSVLLPVCIVIALPSMMIAIDLALKGDSKTKGKLIAIVFKSKKERQLLLSR